MTEREKDEMITDLATKIVQLEQINDEMLQVILQQSKQIRYLEEIQKVNLVPKL